MLRKKESPFPFAIWSNVVFFYLQFWWVGRTKSDN